MKKGIKDIQNINLSDGEKNEIFEQLDLHMKNNPIEHDSEKAQILDRLSSFVMQYKQYVHRYKHSYGVIATIVILCITASTAYAAESSLPGDVLYPIKIYVNESVKAVTKVTPNAKTKFEEEKVIKRLDEVQELVKKGRFDDKKRIQVEKEVEKSVNTINVGRNKNASTTESFRKELDIKIENIKKANVELRLNIPKEKDNKDEIERFEKKIKLQIERFGNNNGDKKENNNSRGKNR